MHGIKGVISLCRKQLLALTHWEIFLASGHLPSDEISYFTSLCPDPVPALLVKSVTAEKYGLQHLSSEIEGTGRMLSDISNIAAF